MMRVYYMTATKWAEVILRERRLKLSRFYESNDPFELSLFDSRNRDVRKVAKLVIDHFNSTNGIICFSANWSSPVMWAHYASKHYGVCLGFDVDDSLLKKVDYTDEKIVPTFDARLPAHGLTEDLLAKVLTTKATDWSYEREYRALSRLTTPDPITGMYYTDFCSQLVLREVLIGHRCSWTTSSTSVLVGDVDAQVRICKVRPAFGKFEMVEQHQVPPVIVHPKELRK